MAPEVDRKPVARFPAGRTRWPPLAKTACQNVFTRGEIRTFLSRCKQWHSPASVELARPISRGLVEARRAESRRWATTFLHVPCGRRWAEAPAGGLAGRNPNSRATERTAHLIPPARKWDAPEVLRWFFRRRVRRDRWRVPPRELRQPRLRRVGASGSPRRRSPPPTPEPWRGNTR